MHPLLSAAGDVEILELDFIVGLVPRMLFDHHCLQLCDFLQHHTLFSWSPTDLLLSETEEATHMGVLSPTVMLRQL